MNIPPGHTEESVLAAIEKAANILAPSFVFGHYDVDDLKQECFIAGIKALDSGRYDPSRPLENFLYSSIRNALVNLKRDKFRRNDSPCPSCHSGQPCDQAVDGCCAKYRAWLGPNQRKANLANPLSLDHVCDERERRARASSSAESDVETAELLELIDRELPVEMRQTYLQMRAGVSVPKARRLPVEKAVTQILRGAIDPCPSADD